MALNDMFLEELRNRNDIESVISSYVNLKRQGRILKGLCPFHNEKTPSFTVYPDTRSFYCFGCGAGGEVITFIRRIENYDFVEAVKFLADRAGMAMPEDNYDDSLAKHRQRILAANREAARFFHSSLMSPKGKAGLDYFLNRGLSMSTIKHFGLGYAPDSWHDLLNHMRSKGFTQNELFDADLVKRSEKNGKTNYYDNFRNRVMTPIIDLRGNVIGFGGRVLDDSKPKYVNTSDTLVYKKTNNVFALNFAKNGNPNSLIVCEGYMDVIALHQAGFTNSVASLGTALTKEQAGLISRYADEVILSYDNDEAGQEATKKAIRIFEGTGVKLRVLKLEGGKDPDEIIKTYGKERFKALLEGAANNVEYRLLRAREKYDLAFPDGRAAFLSEAASILAGCNAIEQDVYASRLADEMKVSKEAIQTEIRRQYAKRKAAERKQEFEKIVQETTVPKDEINPQRKENVRAAKAEDILLASVLNNPEFYLKLKNKLDENVFITDFNRRVFAVLSRRIEDNMSIDFSVLAGEFSPEENGRIAKFLAMKKEISNTLAECEDCIKVLIQEKQKKSVVDPSEMSDEEFLNAFRKRF
ncbi:MAG: DNA primase [Clostridia bacterium]|nr:DNA primase [Clostridia bacterium]